MALSIFVLDRFYMAVVIALTKVNFQFMIKKEKNLTHHA